MKHFSKCKTLEELKAEEEKTAAIKTLLTVNNHGLQDLHTVLGLDFCAPFDAWTINGKFTLNQITNEASKRGYNCRNSVIAVCTRDKSRARYGWSCDFNIATVDGGKLEIEYRTPYHDSGRGLDTFTAKKCFEEIRKSKDAETVVFVQDKANLKRPTERKLDVFGRYKLLKFDYCYNTSVNKKYVNRLYLQEIEASGQRFSHEIIGRVFYGGFPYAETIDQVIDKSGYMLEARRNDLKRRAAALKKEREKAAFVASDNGAKIEELQALIVARKAEIVKALEAATTAAELKSVYDSLSTWKGFTGAVSDFERLKERDASKEYSSIKAFTEAYTAIYNALTGKEVT